MARRIAFAALSLAVSFFNNAADSHAQSAPGLPAFEVASIKLNKGCSPGEGNYSITPGRLNLPCASLRALIRVAYGDAVLGTTLSSRLLETIGGPGWLDSDRYYVSAKAEGKASAEQMMGVMLRALLEDRFKVKVHKESRDKLVYVLTVARSSSNLQPSKEGSCTPLDVNNLQNTVPRAGDSMPRFCGAGGGRPGEGGVFIEDWYGVTMDEYADRMISSLVDRTVIDRTGLLGRFDIHLEFVRENAMSRTTRLNGVDTPVSPVPSNDGAGPSIFSALEKQLGLRLSPARRPLEVIVVDHAEKPSDN